MFQSAGVRVGPRDVPQSVPPAAQILPAEQECDAQVPGAMR